MKSAFKKVTVVIVAFMLILLCSCSNTDGTTKDNSVKSTDDVTKNDNSVKPTFTPATYKITISGNDVYSNGWYYESLDIHTKVKVRKLEPTKGVTWSVYFTEERLSEEEIEKLKEREPDIIDSGEIDASRYNWIYVYCNVNSANSPAPTSDMLEISYQTQ